MILHGIICSACGKCTSCDVCKDKCKSQGKHSTALIMIASIRAALKNGVKHFSENGAPLLNEKEIIEALQADGAITLDARERVERTTDAQQLELVEAEFPSVARIQ